MIREVALVPGSLLLLPGYAGLEDPIPGLRAACHAAVDWLMRDVEAASIRVLAADVRAEEAARGVREPSGLRLARHLLAARAASARPDPGGRSASALSEEDEDSKLLVVANGSACRSEKAPGHFDARALAFDAAIGAALGGTGRAEPEALREVDGELAESLWCHDGAVFQALGKSCAGQHPRAQMDYDDDPFGVQYWVVRWTCES